MDDMQAENAELRRKISGFIISQAIYAVGRLGIADLLADGPVAAEDLAAATGVDADALQRFLRALAAEDMFVEEPAGTFALTRLGGLMRSDVPGSLVHFSALMAEEAYVAWSEALHSLRTGKAAFEEVYGKPHFEWLAEHPEASEKFNRAQAGLVALRLLPLLERPWNDVGTVVDVGGGNGVLLTELLGRHEHLEGIVFDLPHVVAEAKRTLAEGGVADRATCVGGDFFDRIPAGRDVYVLTQILHDWSDDEAVTILRRTRDAIPADGRLLIVEQVVPAGDAPHPAKLLDLHMLVLLGGKERTEAQWIDLLTRGGFELVSVTHGPRSALLEARPA